MTWDEHRWAAKHACEHTAAGMVEAFSARFGWSLTEPQWRHYCFNRLINLKRSESDEPDRGNQRERAWLAERVGRFPALALAAMFREEFGWDCEDWMLCEMRKIRGVGPVRTRRRYPKVRA